MLRPEFWAKDRDGRLRPRELADSVRFVRFINIALPSRPPFWGGVGEAATTQSGAGAFEDRCPLRIEQASRSSDTSTCVVGHSDTLADPCSQFYRRGPRAGNAPGTPLRQSTPPECSRELEKSSRMSEDCLTPLNRCRVANSVTLDDSPGYEVPPPSEACGLPPRFWSEVPANLRCCRRRSGG